MNFSVRITSNLQASNFLDDLFKELGDISSYPQEYYDELTSFDGVAGPGKEALNKFAASLFTYLRFFCDETKNIHKAILEDLYKVQDIEKGWIDDEVDSIQSSVNTRAAETTTTTNTTTQATSSTQPTNSQAATSGPSLDSLKSQINTNSVNNGSTNNSNNDAPSFFIGFD